MKTMQTQARAHTQKHIFNQLGCHNRDADKSDFGSWSSRRTSSSRIVCECEMRMLVRIRLKLTIWCTLVTLLASRSTEPYGNFSNLIRVKLIIHQFMQHIGTNHVRHVAHGNFISVK